MDFVPLLYYILEVLFGLFKLIINITYRYLTRSTYYIIDYLIVLNVYGLFDIVNHLFIMLAV